MRLMTSKSITVQIGRTSKSKRARWWCRSSHLKTLHGNNVSFLRLQELLTEVGHRACGVADAENRHRRVVLPFQGEALAVGPRVRAERSFAGGIAEAGDGECSSASSEEGSAQDQYQSLQHCREIAAPAKSTASISVQKRDARLNVQADGRCADSLRITARVGLKR